MKNFLIVLFIVSTHYLHANIVYVNVQAVGTNDGLSWQNAFTYLPAALEIATVGDEVWVAQGTYFPSLTDNENDSFVMPIGVAIYGGFTGTETELSQRDWNTNTTRLSGEIGTSSASDNSIWVVAALSAGSNCRLDGFVILGGHNFDTSTSHGAGMYIANSSPTIANCTFTANVCNYAGGALYINGGLVNLDQCNFIDNTADFGGGIFIEDGTVYANDCTFKENTAVVSSPCIYTTSGLIQINRCVFTNNYSQSQSSVMSLGDNGQLKMYNSLVAGNYAVNGRAIDMSTLDNTLDQEFINCTIVNNNSQTNYFSVIVTNYTTIANSIIWGNSAGSTGSQIINLTTQVYNSFVENGLTYNSNPVPGAHNTNPQFINSGSLNAAPFDAINFDYGLELLSPAVDGGSNSYTSNIGNFDLISNERIHGSSIDVGAYEFNYCTLPMTITASGPTTFCQGGTITLTATGAESYHWTNGGSNAASIDVSNSGTYEVSGTAGGNCIGSAQITITELNASVNITGNDTYCPGSFTTLTATGNNIGYSWSDGQTGNSALIAQEGWIIVTAEAANGCITQDSVLVNAGVNPNPTVFQSGTNITTGGFSTYQWYFNGSILSGEDNQTMSPTENGSYTVQVTNADGCSGTSQAYTVTWIGIDETVSDRYNFYPNPSHDFITITGGIPDEIAIYSIDGKIALYQKGFTSNQIQLSSLSIGLYSIEIRKQGFTEKKRLIIAR